MTLEVDQRQGVKVKGEYLLPGRAPKTARVFSCLQAMCELRKVRSWERNEARESGGE